MMVRAGEGWCPRRAAPGAGGLVDCRTVMGGAVPSVVYDGVLNVRYAGQIENALFTKILRILFGRSGHGRSSRHDGSVVGPPARPHRRRGQTLERAIYDAVLDQPRRSATSA